MTNNLIFKKLLSIIPYEQIDETIKLNPDILCEISLNPLDPFIGFIEYYEALSKIIPKNFIIVDIGCGYAFQSYLFKEHKQYIGVCPESNVKILPNNGSFYKIDSNNFINNKLKDLNLDIDKVFCICNYVPLNKQESDLLKLTFKNLFYFYPSL